MKPFKTLIFNAVWITLAICIVITAVNFVSDEDFNFIKFVFSKGMLAGFLNGFFLYIGNTLLFRGIRRLLPHDTYYGKRIMLFIPLTSILTILVVFSISFFIKNTTGSISLKDFLEAQRLTVYFNMVIVSIIVSFLIFGFYFYKHFKESQLQQQTLLTKSANNQLDLLKSQLDPHFLFNSLNVLNGLIEENSQNAILFTNDLSKIYRYVLEQNNKDLVSVEEEIAFSETYLNLLSLRFEEGIISNISYLPTDIDEKIPPLSLQLLIENAIKHNVISINKPLTINIYKEENYLYVKNNLQRKKLMKESTGIGLQNITERYELLCEDPIKIETTEKEFTIGIPIIKLTQS